MFQPLLGTDAMRAADADATATYGVAARVLMEVAGRAAAAALWARWGAEGRRVRVLAGRGGNGGDGHVVARVLHARGAHVHVLALRPDPEHAPETAANLALLHRLAGENLRVDVLEGEASGDPSDALADALAAGPEPDVLVDALLGIGAGAPFRGLVKGLVEASAPLAEGPRTRVCALDLPSGLNADTGKAAEGTLRAHLTVAFGALKPGLLLGDGPALAGETVVAEIGIPAAELDARADAFRARDAWVGARLPRRASHAHKYTAGRLVAVAGSARFTGAAVLACGAGARAGAGAVVCCAPASARAALDAHLAHVMVRAQPETPRGGLAESALEGVADAAEGADALLVGCGLGDEPETLGLVRALLDRFPALPTVLDADGLRAYNGEPEALARPHGPPLVITPHTGELDRLAGESVALTDRIGAVRRLARTWGVVLVLKGMPSLVGTPEGRVFVGPPPETPLATAGTGDVLAGLTAGLLAQGLGPVEAAVCALHVGTTAARLAGRGHGGSGAGLVAPDLLGTIPRALARYAAPRP